MKILIVQKFQKKLMTAFSLYANSYFHMIVSLIFIFQISMERFTAVEEPLMGFLFVLIPALNF